MVNSDQNRIERGGHASTVPVICGREWWGGFGFLKGGREGGGKEGRKKWVEGVEGGWKGGGEQWRGMGSGEIS